MEHIKIDININSLEFGKKRCDCYLQVTDSCGTGASLERKQKKQKNHNDPKANPVTTKLNKSDTVEQGKSIQFKCKCSKLMWYSHIFEC